MAFTYALTYRNGISPLVNVFGHERGHFAHFSNETGATAVEYGMIAVRINPAIIAVVDGLGTKLNSEFSPTNSSPKSY